MKYDKLREDWRVILELMRQHKERMALLTAKKASMSSFISSSLIKRTITVQHVSLCVR